MSDIFNPSTGGGGGGVTSFTGDGVIIGNSASTGAVTNTLVNAPAKSVLGNNTGSSAAPAYQNSIAISGTMASGADTITSSSASALAVGQNGVTNPALNVDASFASSVTGLNIQSLPAGSGVTLSVISSFTDEPLTFSSKGGGNVVFSGSSSSQDIFKLGGVQVVSFSANQYNFTGITPLGTTAPKFTFASPADLNITASTEAPNVLWNMSATRQHGTGALALQRDFRIQPTTHSAIGASTIANAATFSLDSPPLAGANATITNASGIYIPTGALTGTVTNSYGLNIVAASGATNNYAALLSGQIVNGGATPAIAAGTGTGGTNPTIAGCNNGGVISVTTGATPTASAVVATVTFTNPFPAGCAVVLYPANAVTAQLSGTSMVFAAGTTTTFVMTAGTVALTGLAAYSWNYHVIGY